MSTATATPSAPTFIIDDLVSEYDAQMIDDCQSELSRLYALGDEYDPIKIQRAGKEALRRLAAENLNEEELPALSEKMRATLNLNYADSLRGKALRNAARRIAWEYFREQAVPILCEIFDGARARWESELLRQVALEARFKVAAAPFLERGAFYGVKLELPSVIPQIEANIRTINDTRERLMASVRHIGPNAHFPQPPRPLRLWLGAVPALVLPPEDPAVADPNEGGIVYNEPPPGAQEFAGRIHIAG